MFGAKGAQEPDVQNWLHLNETMFPEHNNANSVAACTMARRDQNVKSERPMELVPCDRFSPYRAFGSAWCTPKMLPSVSL